MTDSKFENSETEIVSTDTFYSIIGKAVIFDTRLTPKDKGIMVFILSVPPNFKITIAGIASVMGCSKDLVSSAISRLKETGYLEQYFIRDEKGHVKGTKYIAYHTPYNLSTNTELEKIKSIINSKMAPAELPNPETPVVENKRTDKMEMVESSNDQKLILQHPENQYPVNQNPEITALINTNIRNTKNKEKINKKISLQKKKYAERISLTDKQYKELLEKLNNNEEVLMEVINKASKWLVDNDTTRPQTGRFLNNWIDRGDYKQKSLKPKESNKLPDFDFDDTLPPPFEF